MKPQQTETVLVVDDDPAISHLITVYLEDQGITVATAGDGLEAIEREDEVHPCVIVLDLELPRMDGPTFFRQIRSRGSQEPVLILSAYGAKRMARELGAEDALDKPFDPDELVRRVRRLMHNGDHNGDEE
jgi:DNA-binding response OmpR family regulator